MYPYFRGQDLISEYGIQVFWNRIYSLVINVAGGHFDGVCGMCGTYNNNKKDDMVMGPTDQCMPNTIGIAPGTLVSTEHRYPIITLFRAPISSRMKSYLAVPGSIPWTEMIRIARLTARGCPTL